MDKDTQKRLESFARERRRAIGGPSKTVNWDLNPNAEWKYNMRPQTSLFSVQVQRCANAGVTLILACSLLVYFRFSDGTNGYDYISKSLKNKIIPAIDKLGDYDRKKD